jgi:glycosyltransferase involved in cell wall biosynthesis
VRRRPLKVIVATRLFAPEVGAAAFRLKALADGLVHEGAQVQVVTTKAPAGSGDFHSPYRLSRWPVLRDAGGNVRGYVQYLSFDIPAFFRLLVSSADLVVSEPPPTTGLVVALSSWLRRRPFVYYAADIWSEALTAMEVPAFVTRALRGLEGFVLRRAAQVIAVSEPVAEQVAKFGVPAQRVVVVGNGVDTSVFNPDGPVAPANSHFFVYTGTMSEWQGAEVFIKALPKVLATFPEVEIYFYGQGTDMAHLKKIAAEVAPGSVHFGGVIPPREVAERLRGATASLVSIRPDQGYDFAKPTKIYAAAGCGTPVVFAGQGDGAAVVRDNGLGVTANYDPDAVAAAMLEVLAGDSEGRRARSDWVAENASLQASGRIAAANVVSLIKEPA